MHVSHSEMKALNYFRLIIKTHEVFTLTLILVPSFVTVYVAGRLKIGTQFVDYFSSLVRCILQVVRV